jgi:LysR family transcriptional regulator, transcriptional activator of the cysJI operon
MALNLHLLRIFFEVAERRSFSRAAETLFISQPAVSKAVRELERQLDLPLFERGTGGTKGAKGLQLTVSGAVLFDHARGIFALERAAAEDLRARAELKRGRLTVGASTTVASYWLPPYVAEFARTYPAIELQIRVANTQAIGRLLIDCQIDVAIVEGEIDDPRIVATHWRDDELQIIAPPHSPLPAKRRPDLDQLNAEVWLLREPGSGTRDVTARLMQNLKIEPRRTIELGSNEGIARAVAAGLGVAMLPVRVVRELTRLGEIKTLNPPTSTPLLRPLFLLQLKQRPLSPPLRVFCDSLRQELNIGVA